MKKLVCVCVSLVLAMGLSACGAKEETPMDGGLAQEAGAETPISGEVVTGEYLYGKVTSVVGNEIELALAEMPEVPEVPEGSVTEIGDGMVAATLVPASSAGAGEDAESNIELSGEVKNVTIPAGTKIYSMGQETPVTSIKKGSLISMTVDNLTDMNIQRLDILS